MLRKLNAHAKIKQNKKKFHLISKKTHMKKFKKKTTKINIRKRFTDHTHVWIYKIPSIFVLMRSQRCAKSRSICSFDRSWPNLTEADCTYVYCFYMGMSLLAEWETYIYVRVAQTCVYIARLSRGAWTITRVIYIIKWVQQLV